MIGIYKVTSPSGKVYIGQSWNIERRIRLYRGFHCKDQPKLYNSLKKYGIDVHLFEVAHELPSDVEQRILDEYEQLYMDSHRRCGIELLNIREAGSHGKVSEETKVKLSLIHKGKKLTPEHIKNMIGKVGPKKGRKLSESTKQKIGKSHAGIPKTDEQKRKLSAAKLGKPNHKLKGRKFSEETLSKIRAAKKGKHKGVNNPFYGKKHSEETMLKMKQYEFKPGCPPWNKGMKGSNKHTEESKKQILESRKWYKHSEEAKAKIRLSHKIRRLRKSKVSYSFGHLNN